ncbi:MAG: GYF domain-containing protein [Polyangiaceae bacterium]|nr:GYF domain-containing protein [Polyangiaceae bacterium]
MQSATDLGRDLMDEEAPEENWQVQFSDGDTRTLTLEKLDDFYRLGIIDDATLVWQQGMEGWETLGSVLGVEPEAPAQSAIAASPAMVPQAYPQGGPPPLGSAPPPRRTSGPQSATVAREPALPEPGAPVSGINSRPAAGAPYSTASSQSGVQARTQVSAPPRAEFVVAQTDSAWPPVSKPAAPVVASAPPGSVPVVSSALPASLAPAAFTLPPAPLPSGPSMGRGSVALLVGVALVFGGVALFRNDALDQSLLGGPAFGTPRAVDELVKEYRDAYQTVEVPDHLLRQSTGREDEASDDAGASVKNESISKRRSRRPTGGVSAGVSSRSSSSMNDPLKQSGAKRKARANDEYDPLNSNL